MTHRPYARAFRSARETAGIQQTDLASHVGLHRTQLSDMELGKRHAFHILKTKRFAEIMSINPIRLMALAAEERGIEPAAVKDAETEALEALIVLVEMLPDMTKAQARKLRKYLSRL